MGSALYAAERTKEVNLITLWKPQAQFAGYYVARDKGIYERHGLDVTIIDGGDLYPPADFLKDGRADFAVMWLTSAIRHRSQGLPILNIGQIVQRSGLMLIARKSSGIRRPEDLKNKKIGVWDGDLGIQPGSFFRGYGLEVTLVPQSYTVNLFMSGGVDVASAMIYNEYHTILNSGFDPEELQVFSFRDYGLDFPEDGIYALEKTVNDDPARSAAFVQASLEGWQYAFAHPREAVDIVLGYMARAHMPANRSHQTWMLKEMQKLILPEAGEVPGRLDPKDFERVSAELLKNGVITQVPEFTAFGRSREALR